MFSSTKKTLFCYTSKLRVRFLRPCFSFFFVRSQSSSKSPELKFFISYKDFHCFGLITSPQGGHFCSNVASKIKPKTCRPKTWIFALALQKPRKFTSPKSRFGTLFVDARRLKNCLVFFLQNSSKKGPLRFAQGFPLFLAPRGDLWGFPRAPKRAQKAPGRPPGASQKTLSIFGGQKDPLRSCAVLLGGSLGLLGGPWGALGGRVDFPGAPRGGPREATQNPWAA